MDIIAELPKYDNRQDTELIMSSEDSKDNDDFVQRNQTLINLYMSTNSLMFKLDKSNRLILYFLSNE
jgi:hypothetical protein